MNNDFVKFHENKYKGISQVKINFPEKYNEIVEYNKVFGDISWGQKFYNYLNEITELPKCFCGNNLKFYKFGRGYATYCSSECKNKDVAVSEKRKRTFLKKYGVENPLQSKEIQEKRKELFLNKHGVEHQSQLNEVKEKRRNTNLERYGVTTNLLCDNTKEKIKQTYLKKYSVDHQSKANEVKEKKKIINIEKYGVNCNLISEEGTLKTKKTNLEKYGVEYTAQVKEIRMKQAVSRKQTTIKEYAKLLNINIEDIFYSEGNLIINNYCKKHNSFEIGLKLLYQRWYKYDKKICTKCYPISRFISASENEISNFIVEIDNTALLKNKKILKNRFEIDIYVPNKKLAIEFDGLYWHSDIYKDKIYHLNKTNECEEQSIQLLHVFEDEWLYKKEIVKSIIKSKLGLFNEKIFARKCFIKEIETKEVSIFLNKNHIQGSVGSSVKLGLFYKNELVSVMTFGKKRLSLGTKENIEGEYEMLRFCNKLNTSVIGGASKLLKYFINNYSPKSILSFADRRYSNGKLYEKLGFEFLGNTDPNYWYFTRNDLTKNHRFKYRKDVLVKEGFDKNKTEHEIMNERGFLRIYDCGNKKYLLEII